MQPRILIATPTPGMVRVEYTCTVIATIADLANHQIGAAYYPEKGSDPVVQRNVIAAHFLGRSGCTHLFSIDSDMDFDGKLCRRMIELDKPVVAAPYARRGLEFARFSKLLTEGRTV